MTAQPLEQVGVRAGKADGHRDAEQGGHA